MHIINKDKNRIEKAILVGSVAPDQDYKLPHLVHQQFLKIDTLMMNDPKMNAQIPPLTVMMKTVHDRLRHQPEDYSNSFDGCDQRRR